MKKLFLLLFFMSALYTYAENNSEKIVKEEDKTLVGDGVEPKYSILRMQNKVIAGLEVSVNPSNTLTDEFIMRTVANFRIGYRLDKHVLTGSLGVEFTDEMFMPLTVDYKYYFQKERVWAPYIYGQAGYSWHLKGNINSRYNTSKYAQYDPGAMASVGLGYSYTTTLNEFYFSLGYSYRKYVKAVPGSQNEEMIRTDMSMNGVSINIGINF
jgi:hypothetical protein